MAKDGPLKLITISILHNQLPKASAFGLSDTNLPWALAQTFTRTEAKANSYRSSITKGFSLWAFQSSTCTGL
jgi:hypothetical protein